MLILLAARCGRAAAPVPGDAALITLGPELPAVMRELSSSDFKTRTAATARLELALAQASAELLSKEDSESEHRVALALRFNASVCAWLEQIALQPAVVRATALQWVTADNHFSLVALACSASPDERMHAAQQLASLHDPAALALEAQLLHDEARAVYVTAMDGVYDQPPAPETIAALWDRAVISPLGLTHSHRYNTPYAPITFRGKPLGGAVSVINTAAQDGDIATEVLLHLKSPLVSEKLHALLEEAIASKGELGTRAMFQIYMKSNIERLLTAYNTPENVQALHDLVVSEPLQQGVARIPGRPAPLFWWSSRLSGLTMLIRMTHQDPETYGLQQIPQSPPVLSVPSAADEAKAMEMFSRWWNEHQANAQSQPSQLPL